MDITILIWKLLPAWIYFTHPVTNYDYAFQLVIHPTDSTEVYPGVVLCYTLDKSDDPEFIANSGWVNCFSPGYEPNGENGLQGFLYLIEWIMNDSTLRMQIEECNRWLIDKGLITAEEYSL